MADNFIKIHPMINLIDTVLPFTLFEGTEKRKDVFHEAGQIYTSAEHKKLFFIQNLYISKEDRRKYFQYLLEQISVILKNPMISLQSKADIIYFLLSDSALDALTFHDSDSVRKYKNILDIFIQFISLNPLSIKAIIQLTSTKGQDFNHLVNVGIYGIALLLEISNYNIKDNLNDLAAGFFLHDIGKSFIPAEIKSKKTPLNEEEWIIIRQHPEKGYKFLKNINLLAEETGLIILQHHERQNGKGYPGKLKGNQIHMYSKICSIADSFDALSSNRPFRSAQSTYKALEIMHNEMKENFEPLFFSSFFRLFSVNN